MQEHCLLARDKRRMAEETLLETTPVECFKRVNLFNLFGLCPWYLKVITKFITEGRRLRHSQGLNLCFLSKKRYSNTSF